MPRATSRTSLLSIWLCIAYGSALATPRQPVNLSALAAQADGIVLGQASAVHHSGAELRGGIEYVIRVDKVIKGTIQQPTLRMHSAAGSDVPQAGRYALFFLTRVGDGFELAGANGSFAVTRNGHNGAESPLDQVTEILGNTVADDSMELGDRERALDAIARLPTQLATTQLEQAMGKTEASFKIDIARRLVARNDIAGLPLVASTLLHPTGLSESMIFRLGASLAGLKDSKAIPTLDELVAADPHIRVFVARALRQSDTASAIPSLSRLLNDPNAEVRYYAVVGLGEITRQDQWTPSLEEFNANEAKYLSYWRNWAGFSR